MDTTTLPAHGPTSSPTHHGLGRPRIAAAVTSVLITAIGLGWFAGDVLWYFAPDGDRASTSLLTLVPKRVDATVAVLLGLVGLVAALAARGRLLAGVAAAQAFVFVVLAGDAGVLMLMGYLTALLFPVVLLACLVWGAARHRSARVGLAVLLAVVGTAVVASGIFDGDTLRNLGDGLATGTRRNLAPHLVVSLLVGHGLLWTVIGIRASRAARRACLDCGRPGSGHGLLRWRVPVTLVAAACGLPYFLARLTWLTGHPFGVDAQELEAEPGIQVMGFLLGMCGLVAATLTIGLLRPWGRVFPRWIPVVGGRDVPVLFPTLAAGTVGVLMSIAGRAMVQAYLVDRGQGEEPQGLYLLLLPLPLWGPALVLAAAAYYLRFRGGCDSCGADDVPTDDVRRAA